MIISRKMLMSAIAATASVVLLMGNIPAAQATEYEALSTTDKIQQLLESNPGVTFEEMAEAAKITASEQGTDLDAVLDGALAEVEVEDRFLQGEQVQLQRLSGDGPKKATTAANRSIGTATYKGDVFYSPVSTAGITHGHSGLYTSKTSIIEAPGPGKKVIDHSWREVKVAAKSQKQYVKTTQSKRDAAVRQSRKYLGKPYNLNFNFNKRSGAAVNCSQLVWLAYKEGAGIDLDSNGGTGVYPSDIMKSKWTVTYQTIR
ncbi:putative YycO [Bifidobacterium cuniculi]|uniref:Putative YycO n=2 Tax=Bifidobacterium cuniculi TaxID=1688 RepID=A0A087B3C7_9BIFI|nr:putative YycO [Bifidobacterium cuniculi]